MYVVKVEVKDSLIHGKGVFALEDMPKNKVVWQFDPHHDIKMSLKEFESLSTDQKANLQTKGYLSPTSGQMVFPPTNDPAEYTNHSTNNNLTAKYDTKFSDEPYFIANKNIKAGEELTNNYLEFDEISKKLKVDWLKT